MLTQTFKIGLVWHGSQHPFIWIKIAARDRATALKIAADYLAPNHAQTLVIMEPEHDLGTARPV